MDGKSKTRNVLRITILFAIFIVYDYSSAIVPAVVIEVRTTIMSGPYYDAKGSKVLLGLLFSIFQA